MRWQGRAGEREQFDVTDDRDAGQLRAHGNGVTVQWHARRHDDTVEAGKVDLHRIAKLRLASDLATRFLPAVPCDDPRAACHQRFDRGET